MRFFRKYPTLAASLAAFAVLYGIAMIRYDSFQSTRAFADLLTDNSFRGIVAVGMTFVILSGGIDLSVGAVMSLSSMIIGVLVMDYRWPIALAIPFSLGVGTALGAGMGATIHFTGIKPFIVTLAGMFFARGLAFLIRMEPITITDAQHDRLASMALGPLPLSSLTFLAVVLAAAYVLICTPFGRDVYALGGNEEGARLMGRPVARTKMAIYGASGFCSALAGAVLTLYLGSGNHTEGVGMELDAIAAVVIGGTLLAGGVGSVFGTFFGVLLIGLILNIVTTQEVMLSSGLTKVAIGGLLLASVLVQRLITRQASAHEP